MIKRASKGGEDLCTAIFYRLRGKTAVTSKATGTSVHPFICQQLNDNILIKHLGFLLHQMFSAFTVGSRGGMRDVQNMGE